MKSKKSRKTVTVQQNDLSVSYNNVIERVVGLKDHKSFSIPSEILRKREQFWEEFFHRYLQELVHKAEPDVNELYSSRREHIEKPLSVIQYWVDTGYLPYRDLMDKDMQSDTGSSLSEKCLSLEDNDIMNKRSNIQYVKPHCSINPSSSSVDTTAYILSNMNTTNKAETVAIVEGAKNNTTINSQNIQNMKIIQSVRNEMSKESNENVLDNNFNNSQQNSSKNNAMLKSMLQQSTDTKESELQMQIDLDVNVEKEDTSPNTVNTDNEVVNINRCTPYYSKLLNDKLTHMLNVIGDKDSYLQENLLTISPSSVKQNCGVNEFFTSTNNETKIGHRKKLYTGRNSPIDVVNMRRSTKSIICKSKRNLHPALDISLNISKKYKMYRKKSLRKHKILNATRRTLMNHIKNDTLSSDDNTMNSSMKNQLLVKCNTNPHLNMLQSINEFKTVEVKFNKSASCSEESNMKKHQKSNNVIDKSKNLNPVVCLTKLSEDDIKKSTRLKEKTKNPKSLNIIPLSKRKNKKRIKLSKLRNSSTCSTYSLHSSKHILQKNKSLDNLVIGLKAVVHLKRLSESTIQKYKTSANKTANIKNPIILLKKLSESDIKKYKRVNNKDALNTSNSVSKTMQKLNKDVNMSRYSRFRTSNIINIASEDTASDNSTILIYECNCCTDNPPKGSLPISSRSDASRRSHSSLDKLGYNINENNSKCKNKYGTRSKQFESSININSSANPKSPSIHGDVFSNKNIQQCANNGLWFSNKSSTVSSRSSHSSSVHTNSKKKQSLVLDLSDEDDGFVKLIYNLEDVHKSKLKLRHKMLSEIFNSREGTNNNITDTTCNSMYNLRRSRNNIREFTEKQLLSDSKSENQEKSCSSRKSQTFFQQHNLFKKRNFNQYMRETRAAFKGRNSIENTNKSNLNRLCFKTKIFDSDSDSTSVTMSQCSSKN